MPDDDDFANAPLPVREAAEWLATNRSKVNLGVIAIALTVLMVLGATGLTHDVLGWTSGASGTVFVTGLMMVAFQAYFLVRGPLRHASVYSARIDRYRVLRDMGIEGEAPAVDATASDRLLGRIQALAGERLDVVQAAQKARDRACRLGEELTHLQQTMEADPDLARRLTGVQERVESEMARIRAGLAETYAALIELDASSQDATATSESLSEALQGLDADLEVEGVTRPEARRAGQGRQRQGT